MARSDDALAPDAQGPHLHADRRHHRRADHLLTGKAGRRAQLGLPLLLAARCDLHALRPAAFRLSHRSPGMARVAAARGRGLAGFERSPKVRVGNAAYTQEQLDVFGEIMDALYLATLHDIEPEDDAQRVQEVLLDHLESCWT